MPAVKGPLPRLSCRRRVGRHSNLPESLVYSAASGASAMVPSIAGSSPSSTRTWKPLHTPITGLPASTKATSSFLSPLFRRAAKIAPART